VTALMMMKLKKKGLNSLNSVLSLRKQLCQTPHFEYDAA